MKDRYQFPNDNVWLKKAQRAWTFCKATSEDQYIDEWFAVCEDMLDLQNLRSKKEDKGERILKKNLKHESK